MDRRETLLRGQSIRPVVQCELVGRILEDDDDHQGQRRSRSKNVDSRLRRTIWEREIPAELVLGYFGRKEGQVGHKELFEV